jgi:probable F420-dependent oxidoreductase
VEHTAAARAAIGPDPLLAPEVSVVLERDPGRARSLAREFVVPRVGRTNYAENLRALGYDDEDLAGGLSDRLVDALVPSGDLETVAARVREHLDAGADHVCIQVVSDQRSFPLAVYRELAPVLLG